MAEGSSGPSAELTLRGKIQLAWALSEIEKPLQALEWLDQVEEHVPEDRRDLWAWALNRRGQAWWSLADRAQSEDRVEDLAHAKQEILAAWEEVARFLDQEDHDLPELQALNNLNLASYLATREQTVECWERARGLLDQSLTLTLQLFGPFYPDLIHIHATRSDLLGLLGEQCPRDTPVGLASRLGLFREQVEAMEEALRLSMRLLGEDHSLTKYYEGALQARQARLGEEGG